MSVRRAGASYDTISKQIGGGVPVASRAEAAEAKYQRQLETSGVALQARGTTATEIAQVEQRLAAVRHDAIPRGPPLSRA